MSPVSGQIVLVGTVVADGYHHSVAHGARCPMVSIVDCDRLAVDGRLDRYAAGEGFDAGLLLDDTLAPHGWADIRIHSCLPVAARDDGWEPELAALIVTAASIGVAHMVCEPEARGTVVH